DHAPPGDWGHTQPRFGSGSDQAILDFLPDHMLAKRGNIMFGPARDHQPVRVDRNKADHIPDAVSPEAGIVADHQCIVLPCLHLFQTEPDWLVLSYLTCRNKFEENAAVGIEEQPFLLPGILECKKAFRRGKRFDGIDLFADAVEQPC